MEDVRLIHLAQLYLYANASDLTYTQLMADPRAREIAEGPLPPLWRENDMWPMPPWRAGMKGLPPATWASLHCYQHAIDFDFLDVGSHTGIEGIAQATLHKRCGWSNKVYLFEAGNVVSLLEKSVERNRVADLAMVVHAAVTDTIGTEPFYFLPRASAGSSMLASKFIRFYPNTEITEIEVRTLTIDSFVRQNMRPTAALIVKIDTEGAEFKILDGMRETFIHRMVIALVAFNPSLVETYASPVMRLTELTRDFVLVSVGHGEPRRIIPRDDIEPFVDEARRLAHARQLYLIPRRLPFAANLLERIMAG